MESRRIQRKISQNLVESRGILQNLAESSVESRKILQNKRGWKIMIIIGHSDIECEKFVRVQSVSDIDKTFANEVVFFRHDASLERFCKENEVAFAVCVKSVLELIIAQNLGAKYLIVDSAKFAKKCQKIADEYFFDAKILLVIKSEKSIAKSAESGIDGIIFENVLKRG